MKPQDFILKKIVRASTAKEAIELDSTTPVHEVYPRDYDKSERLESAIGFYAGSEPELTNELRRR
jgi:hypothetical protein